MKRLAFTILIFTMMISQGDAAFFVPSQIEDLISCSTNGHTIIWNSSGSVFQCGDVFNLAATGMADHSSNGPHTNSLNAGASITIMDLVYLGSASKWLQADASGVATASGMLAISLESKTDTQAMSVALPGSFIRDDTWNWTPGVVLFISETGGAITATAPTTSLAIVRVIGYAVTADIIFFNPSSSWIELQ